MSLLEQLSFSYQEGLNYREVYSRRFGITPYNLFVDPQTENIIGEAAAFAERDLQRSNSDNTGIPLTSAVANSLYKYTTRGKFTHGRIISGGDFVLGALLQNASCIERAVFIREIFDVFKVNSQIKMIRLLGVPFHHFVHIPTTDEVIDPIVPLMLKDYSNRLGYYPSEDEYRTRVNLLNNISTLPRIIGQLGKI